MTAHDYDTPATGEGSTRPPGVVRIEDADPCVVVVRVAYIVGNPWPICADCKRHVYVIEDTGEWRHFR